MQLAQLQRHALKNDSAVNSLEVLTMSFNLDVAAAVFEKIKCMQAVSALQELKRTMEQVEKWILTRGTASSPRAEARIQLMDVVRLSFAFTIIPGSVK
jgi:hypothetical protein